MGKLLKCFFRALLRKIAPPDRKSRWSHHLAVLQPPLELPRFRLFLKFPVDFCPRVEYTMDEAVLNRDAGELDPGLVEQATSLGLFQEVHAGFAGVFFLYCFRQKLGYYVFFGGASACGCAAGMLQKDAGLIQTVRPNIGTG